MRTSAYTSDPDEPPPDPDDGMVETPYGPLPGCPTCQVIALGAPHVCEHGVTPAPDMHVEIHLTMTSNDRQVYDQFRYGHTDQADPPPPTRATGLGLGHDEGDVARS